MTRQQPASDMFVPPLSELMAFEAASRLGTFTKAAAELSLSPSSISRRVSSLEEMIGARLFERVSGAVVLTQVGLFYAEKIQETLRSLAAATQEAVDIIGRGCLLRLGLPPTFGSRWLVPRIGEFLAAHRDAEVILSSWLPEAEALGPGQLDAVIQFAPTLPPYTRCEKLVDQRLIVVAHPDIAPQLSTYADVMSCTLIANTLRPKAWSEWFRHVGLRSTSRQPFLSVSSFDMVVQAAMDRLGVALVPEMLVESGLKDGKLVSVFPEAFYPAPSLFLGYTEESASRASFQMFKAWLIERCNQSAQTLVL